MLTYAYIDASNLFYGGEKSLGWKIDYKKLLGYLQKKYAVDRVYYFGGVETNNYHNDYIQYESVPLHALEQHLIDSIKRQGKNLNEAELLLASKHLRRIKFYLALEKFGYTLILKPVKTYRQEDGSTKRKANCDVDMTFAIMRDLPEYNRILVLSGDGDFLAVLKHVQQQGKEVIVLARGPRTAKEIKQFAGSNFRDFVTLEHEIRYN